MSNRDCCDPASAKEPGLSKETAARGALVEILYFDGCPNHHPALALVERVGRELGIAVEIRLVNVADNAAAQEHRFLGSPTVRVGGRDVDPQTEARTDYALSCRLFQTKAGIVGQPDERWIREALLRETAAIGLSDRASSAIGQVVGASNSEGIVGE